MDRPIHKPPPSLIPLEDARLHVTAQELQLLQMALDYFINADDVLWPFEWHEHGPEDEEHDGVVCPKCIADFRLAAGLQDKLGLDSRRLHRDLDAFDTRGFM